MKTVSATVDVKLAHLRWLQPPFVGAAIYMVQRGGRLGYVVADTGETLFSQFHDFSDPEALLKAVEEAYRANQSPDASGRGAAAASGG